MNNQAVIAALQAALASDPANGAVRLHLATLQHADGHIEEAVVSARLALENGADRAATLRLLVTCLRAKGELAEALIRLEQLMELSPDEQPELIAELAELQRERGQADEARDVEGRALALNSGASERDQSLADWAEQFDWGALRLTMRDVVGLEDVKQQINLRIIAPQKSPEIYAAFGRDAGGGLLLYGPPGCGKTFIARATAGELAAKFISVSIHDIFDMYIGETEKRIHALFEKARREAPCVLFFDEFDALGGSRGTGSDRSRTYQGLVDQLLVEMDGVESSNKGVMVFAATNMPWNVDVAFRRPGRFDRVLFVPPPDVAARAEILARAIKKYPGHETVDVGAIAKVTENFTAADLVGLCERAVERSLADSLATGTLSPVKHADFSIAARRSRSTAMEWFATARNYGRYANEGGQYDDLVEYLRTLKKR